MNDSQRKIFFYMKIAAVFMTVIVLLTLYLQSTTSSLINRKNQRSYVADLSPVAARSPMVFSEFEVWDETIQSHQLKNLSDYSNKIVHFVFWASWCVPCQTELPEIESLIKKYNAERSVYHVILVNLDETPEGEQKAKNMQKNLNPSSESIYKTSREIAQKVGVEVIPFHIVMDGEGRVAASFYNSIEGEKNMRNFQNLLEQLNRELK